MNEQPDIALKQNSHCIVGSVFALYSKLFLVINVARLSAPPSCSKIDVSKSALLILAVVYCRRQPQYILFTLRRLLDLLSRRLYLSLKTHGAFTHLYKYFYSYIQYLKYKVDCIVTVHNIASFFFFSLVR